MPVDEVWVLEIKQNALEIGRIAFFRTLKQGPPRHHEFEMPFWAFFFQFLDFLPDEK